MKKRSVGQPIKDKYKLVYNNLSKGKPTKVKSPENPVHYAQCVRSWIRKCGYDAKVNVFNGDIYVSFN